MTEEELQRIENKLRQAENSTGGFYVYYSMECLRDIPALIAEVRQLRAALEKAREEAIRRGIDYEMHSAPSVDFAHLAANISTALEGDK